MNDKMSFLKITHTRVFGCDRNRAFQTVSNQLHKYSYECFVICFGLGPKPTWLGGENKGKFGLKAILGIC